MGEVVIILEDYRKNTVIFINSMEEFHFLHILANIIYLYLYLYLHLSSVTSLSIYIFIYKYIYIFGNSHPDKGESISHCGFDVHFSGDLMTQHFFRYLLVTCVSSLEKYLFNNLGPFF